VPRTVIGREAELAALSGFLANASEGAAALVLEGEAGMGKTTLWEAGVAAARERDLLVLEARPAESEAGLSFAALGDLLDPVIAELLEELPPGQARALARALILAEDEGRPPDPHAVGVAVRTALRALATVQPLVLAIDDVQWLDGASVGALSYACRRLRSEHVAVLLARRSGAGSGLVDELRRSLAADRFTALEIEPLDAAAMHRVVLDHHGSTVARPLLAEVRQASGGNPLYAIEIVRTLQRRGVSVEAGQPLPVPESLHELVDERLLALPADCRAFLLAAAAHAHPTVAVTKSAAGVEADRGLAPALEAGIVELEGSRIRFTHPLLAARSYEVADPARRREVHLRLAALLDDPEARALQIAASADEPDREIAAALEDAARHARARGAPRSAALLLDRAGELTPEDCVDESIRRAIEASYLHFESGDSRRAESQLRSTIARLDAGRLRAAGLARLARVRSYEAQDEAARLFLQAIEEAEGDQRILAIANEGVAACFFRLRERLAEAVAHAEVAARLALDLGDEPLAAEALGTKLIAETLLGAERSSETSERALALQASANDMRILAQPILAAAVHWWWADRVPDARDRLVDVLHRATALGDESSVPYVLVLLGQVECALGDLESALEHSRAGRLAAEQSGQDALGVYHLALEASIRVQLGDVSLGRQQALDALEGVRATAGRPAEMLAREALGRLELSLGEPQAALWFLEPAVSFTRRQSIAEPSAARFVVDQIEAFIAVDRRDDAVELLDWYETNARRLDRTSALASCLRCRGLLAAQDGEVEAALAAYMKALERHADVELPLDRGRTLLALGLTQRRVKRRRDARTTLEEALDVFDRIGARLWAERARAELKRISGRAATPGALTPAEERVAALVAEGKTNREVAAALFLSHRTVEGHLARIFGKLGVQHRSEVAPALAAHQTQGIAASNTGDSPVSADPSAP
jgi:DNA-binding CsgD family transcriptional regulator